MRSDSLITLLACLALSLTACAGTPASTPDTRSTPLPENTATVAIPAGEAQVLASPQEPPAQDPATATATAADLPDGKQLVDDLCTICHSMERVSASRKSVAEWQATVERMLGYATERGKFEFTAEQEQAIILYLSKTYR